MCHISGGRMGSAPDNHHGCACSCPAALTVEEEIRLLEDHKKFMQDQTGIIDQKIAALKSIKES